MSESFYKTVRFVGGLVFRVASRPKILHRERAERSGAYLLAANHHGPYDAPLLIAATPRVIYWLSIVELFQNPISRWFLSSMLASPLDRQKTDTLTMRRIVRHLRAGRVVGLFPEGGVRQGAESVTEGGTIKGGFSKLALMAGVPVLPCVILGSEKFRRWTAWLPFFHTRWAVAYGEPLFPRPDVDAETSAEELNAALATSLRALYAEVKSHV